MKPSDRVAIGNSVGVIAVVLAVLTWLLSGVTGSAVLALAAEFVLGMAVGIVLAG